MDYANYDTLIDETKKESLVGDQSKKGLHKSRISSTFEDYNSKLSFREDLKSPDKKGVGAKIQNF
jgi:hypothetical protein